MKITVRQLKRLIKEAIEDMDKSFDKVINEMNSLREKCRVIMSYNCA